ncbi:MAG: sensor histidine kinase [Campylobacterota bacterium]
MLKILLIVFLYTLTYGDVLEINSKKELFNTSSSQKVYIDKNHDFKLKDILENNISSNYNRNKASYSKATFWTKFIVKNVSNTKTSMVFRNNRAGIDNIDVYIYNENKELFKYIKLGDLENPKDREILGNRNAYKLTFKSNEKYIIITKYNSLGSIDLHWDIVDSKNYSYTSILEYIFWGLFAGIVLALILYNFLMFISLKNYTYLYYVLHGFFILCFTYALNGIFYVLNVGFDLLFLTISTWISTPIFLLFINLFTKEFFKINKSNILLNKIFNLFLMIHIVFLILFIYSLTNTDILMITPIFLAIITFNILFIVLTAIWAIKKRLDGALFFLIGESIYLSSLLVIVLFTFGIIQTSYLTNFIFPLGVLLEIVFLAIALSSKISKIKEDNDKKDFLLSQEKNVTDIGKTVKNLSHQFRQPLSYISSQILYLETLYNHRRKEEIIENFSLVKDKINYSIECMSQTLSLFSNFYTNEKDLATINPNQELEKLIGIYEQRIILNNIRFEILCNENLNLKTFKGCFSNIISILLENSIESFELEKVTSPKITIIITQNKDITYIKFKDNGIGINVKPLTKVFEPSFTTKQNNYGLGLNIAKILIEEKLRSKISVECKNYETIFTLKLAKLF